MSNQFPAIIAGATAKSITDSQDYLLRKRKELLAFSDVEDLVTSPNPPKDLVHHLGVLKIALAKTLWPRQFFIGPSILDDLLFEAFQNDTVSDPLTEVFAKIARAGVHEPGMVVYPLHSFGLLGFGFLTRSARANSYIDLPEAGICICTQTNSMSDTLAFLEHARQLFGITQAIPDSSVNHHRRVSLEWLERNQLMAVKASAFSGYAYENQQLLTIKLEIATTLIFMLSVMEPSRDEELLRASSSSRANNWQTLDIDHYLVFERTPNPASELTSRRIPMNVKRTELINLCDLQVDLDPTHWLSRPKIFAELVSSLISLESAYMRHVMTSDTGVGARINRKVFESLGFFRRSFHSQAEKGEPAIFLATAFEMLLTDSFASGVKSRLVRRYELAASAVGGEAELASIVGSLYDRRSETVHQGNVDGKLDLRLAQKAFAYAFIGVATALEQRPASGSEPIAEILGDKITANKFHQIKAALRQLYDALLS